MDNEQENSKLQNDEISDSRSNRKLFSRSVQGTIL